MNSHDERQPLKGRVGFGVRRAFSLFYPDYVSADSFFPDEIARYLEDDNVVLDAGCGGGTFFRYPWKNRVRLLVGCDLSESVRINPNIAAGVQADLARLPFSDGSVHIVICRYVLEHIDAPATVFAELARVLKPQGKLIVLTPSKYHYVTFISRLAPHWFHEMVSRLRGNSSQDTFPTRYLANSKADLGSYAKQGGLTLRKLITREVCPNYLLWSLPTFLLGVAYERLVNRFEVMSPFRVTIIAVFER